MIMRWNVIFRVNEKFPHPNYYIELGKVYVPLFLESFPESKIKLRKWANRHLETISCEAVANEMKRNIIPKIYDTYVRSLPPHQNKPSYESFLNCFGLKKICVSTVWRWMHYLGYTFDERKKCYFTDRHEDVENVTCRKEFVKTYFEYEKRAYRWVHITEERAKELENDKDVRLMKDIYDEFEENHIKMRQYHIDTHPIFSNLVPKLSIHNTHNRPLMIIGQDESVFKQYSFGSKCWIGPDGEMKLLPKSDGYSRMVSAFVSRDFGFGLQLSKQELDKVNERRLGKTWGQYLSKKESIEVYGNSKKKVIEDQLTLVRFFDIGMNEEGYWNFNHMALQVEDVFDVLSVKFPEYDFLFLMDQSSGHGRMREDALNVNQMSVKWGGKQSKLRKTTLLDIGPYPCLLKIGDEQEMVFKEGDTGPFYMSTNEQLQRKYDRSTGKIKVVEKTKKELIEELKKKKFIVRGHYSKDELRNLASDYGISLTYETDILQSGWVGKAKGMLQVLYERGWIDESKLHLYSEKGRTNQLDEDGKVREEFKPFVLRTLLSNCRDFKEEKSAMEVLMDKLSSKGTPSVELLTTPKYHCELAGEGIEYSWGMGKYYYRNLPLETKNSKSKFIESVRLSVTHISIENVIRFAGKSRRYMLAYHEYDNRDLDDPKALTYKEIERFVKKSKCHKNVSDQDTAYLARVWKNSYAT